VQYFWTTAMFSNKMQVSRCLKSLQNRTATT
jgi:hypothetical protein